MKLPRLKIKPHSRILRLIWIQLLLVFSLAGSGFAQSINDDELLDILTKVKHARSDLSYSGLLEVHRGTNRPRSTIFKIWVQPPSIYHMEPQFKPNHRHEMRKSETARGRGRMPRFRPPFHRSVSEFLLFPRNKYLSLFRQNYNAELQTDDPIAGRLVKLLTIKPNHLPRFGMRLWYDQTNHLILKREIIFFKPDEELISFRQEFKEIRFDEAVPDSILKVAEKNRWGRDRQRAKAGEKFDSIEELMDQTESRVFTPDYVPEGCELAAINYNKENGRKIIHLHYTDGLLGFSIFEIAGPPPRTIEGLMKGSSKRKTASHDFQQMVVKRKNGYSFLLLGNFPRTQLRKIADSLEAKQ